MAGTRKLGKPTDQRLAMLKTQTTDLILNGKLVTTEARAKEVKAMTNKLITKPRLNNLPSKRQVSSYITKETVAKKVFDEIAPKYKERNGGYSRIIKVGPRRGDAAEMAIIELV